MTDGTDIGKTTILNELAKYKLKKVHGQNLKDSDFHFTCPLVPEKIRETFKRHSYPHP
jgi:hypothetical protein